MEHISDYAYCHYLVRENTSSTVRGFSSNTSSFIERVFKKMNFNIPQFFINVSITLQFAFSGELAIVDDSPKEVAHKVEKEYRDRRLGDRNLLRNSFDFTFSLKVKDTDTINKFQPLLIDYVYFQYFYIDSQSPIWNPINVSELHSTKFYFESSALIAKQREQVFTDFYIKYNAAFAFLHFWITRFVIRHTMKLVPKDKAERDPAIHNTFLMKCDEITFYTYWLVDLDIDRHLDEIDLKLRNAVPKDEKFHEVIAAYESIIKTVRSLIQIEPFLSEVRQRMVKFNRKINPFNSRVAPVEIEPQDEKWMRIIKYAEDVKAGRKSFDGPENFFKTSFDDYDGNYSREHANDLSEYMKYLHDNSWTAIRMVIGPQLRIMESFFYSTFTGVSYPHPSSQSFMKPEFSYTKKLWRELECIYYFWNPNTFSKSDIDDYCEKSSKLYYSKRLQEEGKLYLITVLREIDNLRFDKSYHINLRVTFKLKTCSECFFRCRCYGSFRMIEG